MLKTSIFRILGGGGARSVCVKSRTNPAGGATAAGVSASRGYFGRTPTQAPLPTHPPRRPDLLQSKEKELLGEQLWMQQQQLRIRAAAAPYIPRHRRRQETSDGYPQSSAK